MAHISKPTIFRIRNSPCDERRLIRLRYPSRLVAFCIYSFHPAKRRARCVETGMRWQGLRRQHPGDYLRRLVSSRNSSRRTFAEPAPGAACTHAPTISQCGRESKERSHYQLVLEVYMNARALVCMALGIAFGALSNAYAEQPPPPCHPNPNAAADRDAVAARGDIAKLPQPLKDRLIRLADRPHTYLPLQVFSEADHPRQPFPYYLLDAEGFEPNVFTTIFPGVNDQVQLSATGGNCGLTTIGTVRVVLEPKPGLPTDPNNPRAFNDVFTDISPLFVINNESGWYEGWMIHDITVPNAATPRNDGHAQFGTITQQDAAILARLGTGNNVPGNIFTIDGGAPHFPSASDTSPTHRQM